MISQCFADSGRALDVGENVNGAPGLARCPSPEMLGKDLDRVVAHPPGSHPENLSRWRGTFKTTGGGSLHW